MNKIVFGVDPAFANFGLVVYDVAEDILLACYTFRTKKEAKKRGIYVADDDSRRLAETTREYLNVIDQWKPKLIFSETPAGGAQGFRPAQGLAYANALATIPPLTAGITVVNITARDAKKAATGKVDGSKEAVAAAVRKRFPGAPHAPFSKVKALNEHQYDAASTLMAGMLTPYWAALS